MAERMIKAMETSRMLGQIIKQYYRGAQDAKANGIPVLWSTGITAPELFWAMDFYPLFPENYAAACGTKQLGPQLIEAAEKEGFSPELCSYFRSDLGQILTNCNYLGGMPPPDIVVSTRALCILHNNWWRTLARYFQVPVAVWDIPLNPEGWESSYRLDYAVAGLQELITQLEGISGKKLDWGKLKEAVVLGDKAAELWADIYNYRKLVPTPIGATDMMANLFCLVTLSGTPEAVNFLEAVKKEVAERAANKFSAVENERIRLVWDVIPMWHRMDFFNRLEQEGVVFVFELYNAPDIVWGRRLDPDHILESLALRQMTYVINVIDPRADILGRTLDWHIDGYVAHIIRTCNALSAFSTNLARIMQEKFKVPTLLLSGDHCDPRYWNDGQVMQRVNAFLELLASNPKRS